MSLPGQQHDFAGIEPTQKERDLCSTERQVLELEGWYVRFNELSKFKEQNGHCELKYSILSVHW